MKSLHQINIENYHSMIEAMHLGHNMHVMHRDWHVSNPDPELPTGQNPNWGVNLIFGTNFLQMHHEMVKATNSEPRQHMMHDSVAQWYKNEGLDLPQTWDPSSIIPQDLNYEPDASIYPDEIRIPIEQYANSQGQTIEQFLTRTTNDPKFTLPAYLSVQGVNDPSKADPLTGAMKLSDYVNSNQLGCSLVFPHNEWHGAIGGAMTTTWTAIADPIFYLGVHTHVDRIFDEFKLIEAERSIRALDFEVLTQKGLPSGVEHRKPRKFTEEERKKVEGFLQATKAIRAPFSN